MKRKAIGQIIQDCHPVDQPANSIRFGKNGIQNKVLGTSINEPGFLQSNAKLPYRFNGVIETDSNPIIFSTDDTFSAIGFYDVDKDEYIPIIDDRQLPFKLGFKRAHYIKGEFQKNNLGEYVIAFTDKVLPPMYLNCTTPNIKKYEDILFFAQPKIPNVSSIVTDGGGLATGSYKAYIKLVNDEGSDTHYLASSQYQSVSENGSGAIRLKISNVDESYSQLVVAFLIRENGAVKAIELDPVPVSTTVEVLYTGNETYNTRTVEEILVGAKTYNRVGTIGQLNGSIYFGKLEDEEEIDFQPYANNIKALWSSKLVDCTMNSTDADSMKSGGMKSFCHDEVYALYIRLVFSSGVRSKAFHIPGPEATTQDLEPYTTAGFTGKKFHFNDTVRDLKGNSARTGVWYNDAEVYPTGFGELSGTPVRHHKMPSQWFVKSRIYANDNRYGSSHSDVLGIRLENVQIPADISDRIVGYEVLYAKRTTGNASVFGQAPLILNVLHGQSAKSGAYTADTINSSLVTSLHFSSGGNWNNKMGLDRSGNLSFVENKLSYNSARIHPIEMIEFNLKLNQENSYLKLDTMLSTSAVVDTKSEKTCVRTVLLDYTNPATTSLKPLNQPVVAKISGLNYIKANKDFTAINGVNNLVGEDAIVLNFADGVLPALPSTRTMTNITYGATKFVDKEVQRTGKLTGEDTYLATLKVFKSNVYQSFLTQTLIETEQVMSFDNNEFLYRGDVLKAQHTIHQVAPIGFYKHKVPLYTAIEHEYSLLSSSNDEIEAAEQYVADGGIRVIRNVLVESAVNLHTRFKKSGINESEWYFNAKNTKYAFEWDCHKDPNDIGYTKDLNALSEVSVEVFSNRRTTNKFPYRIHRGGKMAREGEAKNWRRFLPLDYFDMQKNLGEVVNIVGLDDALLIHLENSLLVTRDKTRLETDSSLGVILGTADIFQFAPQEAMSSKLGIGGLKSDQAYVLTPAGYMFFDGSTGKAYLYKGELIPLNAGLDQFFRTYGKPLAHNVLTGDGVTLGYDPEFERVLLTVKNTNISGYDFKHFEDNKTFFNELEEGDMVEIDGEYMTLIAID